MREQWSGEKRYMHLPRRTENPERQGAPGKAWTESSANIVRRVVQARFLLLSLQNKYIIQAS